MTDVVVTHAVRTPIGRFCGSLKSLSAVDFTTSLAKSVLEPDSLTSAVDKVLIGMARQAGGGPNPARQVSIFAGIPEERTAVTVNMACGSGLLTVLQAADDIRLGRSNVVLAGGMESMTQVPFILPAHRLGHRLGHGRLEDNMYTDGFHCKIADQLMGATAETLADDYDISRDEQDAFAVRSQQRCGQAVGEGWFDSQIRALTLTDRKGNETEFSTDEHPRPDANLQSMAKLKPVFRDDGSVTAGNSSGITDGAALLVLMSREEAQKRDLEILATLGPWAEAGVDPKRMGLGPVPSTNKVLAETDSKIDDYDLIELNEAFAAQVIACDRELGLPADRLNVNGGSIALGHPIGCTGARIAVTLIHEMKRREARRGLATLCISGGQGLAVEFNR